MMIFAHVGDTHFDGGERARLRARRVMTWLRPMPLDAIVVSGDIADHGAIEEYEEARAELVAPVPVLMLPGNHDVRAAYRKVLGEDSGDGPINSVHRVGGVLFALCDSSIPGRHDGLLAPGVVSTTRLPWTTPEELTRGGVDHGGMGLIRVVWTRHADRSRPIVHDHAERAGAARKGRGTGGGRAERARKGRGPRGKGGGRAPVRRAPGRVSLRPAS
ncbi:MAG: hypothetical protein HOU81_02620 [Hamadaea sp.]|nr:hypothetical protein [Hamadaea sp.]